MRVTMMAAAALLGAAAWPAAARAEDKGPAGAVTPNAQYIEYQKRQDEEGPDPELETEHYDRQLKLTPDQRDKVHRLFVEQREMFKKSYSLRMSYQREVQALHQRILEKSKRFEAEGNAIEEQRASILKRLRGALTPKQQSAFDMMQAERNRQENEWKKHKEEEDLKKFGGDGVQGRFGSDDREDQGVREDKGIREDKGERKGGGR